MFCPDHGFGTGFFKQHKIIIMGSSVLTGKSSFFGAKFLNEFSFGNSSHCRFLCWKFLEMPKVSCVFFWVGWHLKNQLLVISHVNGKQHRGEDFELRKHCGEGDFPGSRWYKKPVRNFQSRDGFVSSKTGLNFITQKFSKGIHKLMGGLNVMIGEPFLSLMKSLGSHCHRETRCFLAMIFMSFPGKMVGCSFRKEVVGSGWPGKRHWNPSVHINFITSFCNCNMYEMDSGIP